MTEQSAPDSLLDRLRSVWIVPPKGETDADHTEITMHSEESDIPTDQPSRTDDTPIDLSPSTWRTDSRPRTPPIAKSGDTNGHTAVEWEAIRDGTAGTGDELANPAAYLNRELSELSFQWRVLYEALDDENPPLERLKFLAILTKNMDEFFMKRIGGLKQQIDAEVTDETVDGRTPHEQWGEALDFARPIFETQSRCYHEAVKPVENETLQDELDRILDSLLGDNRKRWEMDATGRYVQQRPGDGPQQIAHEQLMQRARQAVPDTPTEYETAEPDQRETAVDLDDVYLEEPFDQ